MINDSFPSIFQSTRSLNKDDTCFIMASFKMADHDKKGYLFRNELKIAMTMLFGHHPSRIEVDQIFDKGGKPQFYITKDHVDKIKDNDVIDSAEDESTCYVLDLLTYKQLMTKKLEALDPLDDIRESFQYFDSNYKGYIEFEDFKKIVLTVLPNCQTRTLSQMFHELDSDGDGRVSFRDFELMMEQLL